jgi:hypothetical protein
VTTTHNHSSSAGHTATAGRGISPRLTAAVERLSDRIHAVADDRAGALGWQVTSTPGRLGIGGRSYRDPRFAARRQALQGAHTGRDKPHE